MNSDAENFETHSNCVACGSGDLLELAGYKKHYLRKCKACKLVFVGRIPREEELQAFYSQYSYAREQWLSPITRKRYRELLAEFEPFRQTGRILDSGCGAGFFLEEAKAAGWEVWGTEYSDEAIKLCTEKGISMHHGSLQDAPFEEGFFDVVTSFEVIEHLHHVKEEAKSFHSLLRTGGLLYCTTPNFNAITRYYLKEKYNVIGYPEHLSYFSPKSINSLFQKAGFRKRSLTTTGISITRIKKSLGKSQQAFISPQSDDEQLRQKMEEKWHWKVAKRMANGLLGLTGKGVTLKAYYIKK